MLKAMPIWSTIFALLFTSIARATDLPLERKQLAAELVPPVPPWPDGLPDPKRLEDGSAIVPAELGKATEDRLELLLRYPDLCRVAVEQMARIDRIDYTGQLAVQAVEAQKANDQKMTTLERKQLTPPKVGLIAGIGVVIGIIATIYLEHHK